MQILYALPFILLSGICCAVCLVIPRMRHFALAAAVGPVAFGFCSIVGVAAVLIAENIGWVTEPNALFGFVGVVSGVIGAWIAVLLANRVRRHLGL